MSAYTQGHSEAVTRSHAARTALNAVSYVIPHLQPHHHILDVGCGPGTISLDLAAIVSSGSVVAVDNAESVIAMAVAAHAKRPEIANITFRTADAYHLDFPDGTFDVVHTHQLLIHLPDPVSAIKEFRRVLKPGGFLALKEGDLTSTNVYPDSYVAPMQSFTDFYVASMRSTGAFPDAGRRLHAWVREAGFARSNINAGAMLFCYSGQVALAWWCGMWADRCKESSWRDRIVEGGFADAAKMEETRAMWKALAAEEDGWLTMTSGEVIAKKEE